MWDKKGQIADTMTWVVATLVIVVVLGILVFVTYSVSDKKLIFLDDKKKDFIATKSITSFLRNQNNIDLLMSDDSKKIESEMKKFLEEMSISKTINPGGWNLEIEQEENKIKVFTYRVLDFRDKEFNINLISDKIKLYFWKECQGGCIK